MSFEEPKAPIVRIRKKRTKKKSKDNDIVHLPVRASQQGRYSSLTTPPNPQTKGRECCRQIFACCMKIPVCRMICFRCILPKCYSGEGSDDEETNIKDEGYHSQNRRSSEIIPNPEGGAHGGMDPQSVEMTEIKSETVTLIPPPRTKINDYRKDPCKSEKANDNIKDEVTYIEVESVSLTGSVNADHNIPDNDSLVDDSKTFKLEATEMGYEEPVHVGVPEFTKLKSLATEDCSEYVDCDKPDNSESQVYVNDSVLGIHGDSGEKNSPHLERHYINIAPSGVQEEMHSEEQVEICKPHEYVNLPSFESTEIGVNKDENGYKVEVSNTEKETEIGNLLEEVVNEIKFGKKDIDDKILNTGTKERDEVKQNELNVKDSIDHDKDFVIENSDGEKLLDKKKTKVHKTAKAGNDTADDSSDNEGSGDQTKLI